MGIDSDLLDSGPTGITRRTVMKGAAWAVPVIALASSAPAFASSIPANGLDGVFTVDRNCSDTLTQQGGSMSVTQTQAGQVIKKICLLFSVTSDSGALTNLTWSPSGSNGWSQPTYIGTTTYAGTTWGQYQTCLASADIPPVTPGTTEVNPSFEFDGVTLPAGDVQIFVQRVVSITGTDGTTVLPDVTYIYGINDLGSEDCGGFRGGATSRPQSISASPKSGARSRRGVVGRD